MPSECLQVRADVLQLFNTAHVRMRISSLTSMLDYLQYKSQTA